MRPRGNVASRLRKTREGWDFASAAETNSQDQQPRTCPKPLVPINAFGETNSQDQQPRTLTRAECNSTPAVNLDNENPTLTALGKKLACESNPIGRTGANVEQKKVLAHEASPIGRTGATVEEDEKI